MTYGTVLYNIVIEDQIVIGQSISDPKSEPNTVCNIKYRIMNSLNNIPSIRNL